MKGQLRWRYLQHWRGGTGGALLMGVHHGLYCVGCCVGLMTALVTLGMMSPVWMVTVALVVLFEKVLPQGERFALPIGVGMMGVGIAVGAGWLAQTCAGGDGRVVEEFASRSDSPAAVSPD